MISSSAGLKDSWTMVLHSWEFWKPVSNAMVRHLNKAGDDKHSNHVFFFRNMHFPVSQNVPYHIQFTTELSYVHEEKAAMTVATVVGAKNVLF